MGDDPSGPVDVASFDGVDLRPALRQGIARLGFETMTDIQAKALPVALSGSDVVGTAATGTGKTAVFALAMLEPVELAHRGVQGLVLCPTRELAVQVTQTIRALGVGLAGLRVVTVMGGTSELAQRRALRAGAHVVVGTPGRVLSLLQHGVLEASSLKTLVLDEADRLLDMGFQEQVSAAVACLPEVRQTLMFSATWSTALAPWVEQLMQTPVRVAAEAVEDVPQLTRRVVHCTPPERLDVLVGVLARREAVPTMVFCETRAQCRAVTARLRDAGAAVAALHGELMQRDRDAVVAQLSHGSVRVLVATNVAARGLDLTGLDLVVCVEPSPEPEVHVHRVGRTARAKASGEAVVIVAGAREQARVEQLTRTLDLAWETEPCVPTRGAALAAWDAPFRTLTILGGRRDKLRAGDVLGALTRGVGLAGEDVGQIDVGDTRVYVAIRRAAAGRALRGLAKARIKKRRFRVLRQGG